jgi:uncharacterized membrane protein
MFRFCNKYPLRVQVAFMWYDPTGSCSSDGQWATKGWWILAPGECKTVFGRDLQKVNKYYYYYAESPDDGFSWRGNVNVYVPYRTFESCLNIGSTDARVVGFRKVDIGSYNNYTLNLIS